MGVCTAPFRGLPGALAAPAEMTVTTFVHEPIDFTEGTLMMTKLEIVGIHAGVR